MWRQTKHNTTRNAAIVPKTQKKATTPLLRGEPHEYIASLSSGIFRQQISASTLKTYLVDFTGERDHAVVNVVLDGRRRLQTVKQQLDDLKTHVVVSVGRREFLAELSDQFVVVRHSLLYTIGIHVSWTGGDPSNS